MLEELNLLENNIKDNIVAFIDNDEKKQKEKIGGLECLSINKANKLPRSKLQGIRPVSD